MKKRLLILWISPVLLTACITGPYKGESTISNAAKGGGSGAVAGAGAGTLFGGNDLKNAGTGALAGGAIGAYMDSQQQEMQQSLQGTAIEVKRTAEDTLSLNMPSSIAFAYNSATLTPQAQTALDFVAKVLNHYSDSKITIAGYTADTGSDGFNLKLSEQRAASVSTYLSLHNVDYTRLTQRVMGESMPELPNTSEANRAQNSCVELVIVADQNAGAQQGTTPQQQDYLQQQGNPQQHDYLQQQDELLQQGYPQPQF